MLVNPVKDLLDAFVIGAVNRLFLQLLQWKISILNHGGAVPERAPDLGAVID